MLEGMSREKKIELYLALALAFTFICYLIGVFILYEMTGIESEVMRDRYWKDVVPLFEGKIPIMEYPPFALIFMAIPGLFTYWTHSAFIYNIGFVVEIYIFTIIGLELFRLIAERYGVSQIKVMLLYSVFIVLMLPFVADRYDIIPAILCLGAFYLFITKRYIWTFVLLALGALTKVYPAFLMLPFMMLFLIKRDWKSMFQGAAVFIITAAAVILPFYLIEPESVIHFITYNSDRPLEVGSVVATLIYPFSMIGMIDVSILPWTDPGSYGSDDLIGPVPDAIAGIMSYVMAAFTLAAVLFYGFIRNKRGRNDEALFLMVSGSLMVVMALIVFGKVFSSQYLLWAMPLFLLAIMMCPDHKFSNKLAIVLLAIFIFTEINCGYIYAYLNGGTNINDLCMILMLLRNLVVIYAMYMVGRKMWEVYRDGFSGKDLENCFDDYC